MDVSHGMIKKSIINIDQQYGNLVQCTYGKDEKLCNYERLNINNIVECDLCGRYHNRDLSAGNILVVDDDPIVADQLKSILGERGYNVILSSNFFNIVRTIKENKVDLVILDLILPGIDGCEIARLIRKTEYEIPIIMLSASTKIENKIRSLSIGADDYITKPFEEKELLARVERALARAINFREAFFEDSLTGAYTKNFMRWKMKEIMNAYRRNQKVFSIAFVDMDDFKDVNDVYGHLLGDEILKCFVCGLKSSLRSTDYVFRFGGDEFIIVFSETDERNAYNVLERFRNSVNYRSCVERKTGIAFERKFSAGIAEIKSVDDEIEDIINRADIALYEAKALGKNNTRIYNISPNK